MADLSTVARPYARALFEVATESGDLGGWSAALAAAAAVLSDSGAQRFLARPDLDDGARVAFVEELCRDLPGTDRLRTAHGRNLLRLLAENDRLTAVPGISAQFDALKARAESKVKVTLVSAAAIEDTAAERIAQALRGRLGRTVDLELEVDPALLGGAIVRADDMVIDGSVKSRLQRLAESLVD